MYNNITVLVDSYMHHCGLPVLCIYLKNHLYLCVCGGGRGRLCVCAVRACVVWFVGGGGGGSALIDKIA